MLGGERVKFNRTSTEVFVKFCKMVWMSFVFWIFFLKNIFVLVSAPVPDPL